MCFKKKKSQPSKLDSKIGTNEKVVEPLRGRVWLQICNYEGIPLKGILGAREMPQWVTVFAVQVWRPRLNPRTKHTGGRRDQLWKVSSDPQMHSGASAPLPTPHTYTIIIYFFKGRNTGSLVSYSILLPFFFFLVTGFHERSSFLYYTLLP